MGTPNVPAKPPGRQRSFARLARGLLRHRTFMPGRVSAYPSIPSNSAIIPSIMPSPICQKPGSLASRPKGASNSE
jgi:hypothetical protein